MAVADAGQAVNAGLVEIIAGRCRCCTLLLHTRVELDA
jgi:hypothetical protein